MLRQNFSQEPVNEQSRISQSEMRQVIELYDEEIGISNRRTPAPSTGTTQTDQPTVADLAELLGISPMEVQRLLNRSREQERARSARVAALRTPPTPMVTVSPVQPMAVVQNVIVDPHAHLFQKFEANRGDYMATWNWGAFLFGPFWYLYKGMWVKALIYTFLGILATTVTFGSGGFFYAIALGLLGNYDYYLLRCHDTQTWTKRRNISLAPPTFQTAPGPVVGSFSTPPLSAQTPTQNRTSPSTTGLDQMAQKLQLLRETYERGLITQAEYEEKRLALLNEVENQADLQRLAEMHRMGLLTDYEYQLKREALLRR